MASSDRRAQILDAALELFDDVGYSNTGMTDIAERCGMKGPSLYNHFSSKQELLSAILVGVMNDLLSVHALAMAGADSPRERLRASVKVHVTFHCNNQMAVRTCWREIKNLHEPHRSFVLQLRRDYASRWVAILKDGIEAGEFSVSHPGITANALIDMGLGIADWYAAGRSLSVDDLAEHYATLAERSVIA